MVRLPEGGLFHLAKASLVIGRGREADLVIDSPRLSNRHCRLFFDGHLWQIVDLDSKNGLAVNGDQLKKKELQPGDQIDIEEYRVVFEPPEEVFLSGLEPELQRLAQDARGTDPNLTFLNIDRFVSGD